METPSDVADGGVKETTENPVPDTSQRSAMTVTTIADKRETLQK